MLMEDKKAGVWERGMALHRTVEHRHHTNATQCCRVACQDEPVCGGGCAASTQLGKTRVGHSIALHHSVNGTTAFQHPHQTFPQTLRRVRCLSVTVWHSTTSARRFIRLMPANASRRATTLTMLAGAALSTSEPSAAGVGEESSGVIGG